MGRIIALISFAVFAFSCAQVGVPSGGEVDKSAPEILYISPSLGEVNVPAEEGGMIEVEFDEYVNVRQLSAQLLVSPPLKKPVKWLMKGREVQFIWEENLQENTTYVFQFGESIVDVHESNPASSFIHAFSTGPVLDTLSLSGTVEDVFTDEKQKAKKVFLYDASMSVDSILLGVPPLFVSTTDSKGNFTINYLPTGNYRVLALDDVDRNYMWTAGEALGINEAIVEVTAADTLPLPIKMQMTSNTEVKYFVSSIRDSLGLVKAELSGEVEYVDEIDVNGLQSFVDGVDMWVWGDPANVRVAELVWLIEDTLKLAQEPVSELVRFVKVKAPEGKQISGNEALFTFSRPVENVIESGFSLLRSDSVEVEIDSIYISEENPFAVMVEAGFGRGVTLELTMLPGSVRGQGRQVIEDTVVSKWSTFKLSELADLVVEIESDGWLELISANGKVVESVVLDKAIESVYFKNLTPGSYALRWLGDSNNNGKWDGVSLEKWKSPEPARIMPTPVVVKADWSHLVEWDLEGN
jgi:hypothetical protein